MPPPDRPRDSAVQSVDRAVSVLELLAELGSAGVTQLAEELGIHKSTVFRLLMTLEARGMIEQDIDRGKYRIGHTVVHLASGAAQVRDIAEVGRSVCLDLAAEVGETVHVAVHDGLDVITVDQALGGAALTTVDWVGKRQPFHATAAGKVFLASMNAEARSAVLSAGLQGHTVNTITDPSELEEQLATVRRLGYATAYEEHAVGLVALAMPVRAFGGEVAAAVTISGPAFRVNERTMPSLLDRLAPAAAQISWRMGLVKRQS